MNSVSFYSSFKDQTSAGISFVYRLSHNALIEGVKIVAASVFLYLLKVQLEKTALTSIKWKSSISSIVIVAPVLEEVLFRGIFLRGMGLCQKGFNHLFYKRPLTEKEESSQRFMRIQFSALSFGSAHLLNPYSTEILFTQTVTAYIAGIQFGYLSEKYETLSVTILAHGMHNALVVASELYPKFRNIIVVAIFVNSVGTFILAFAEWKRESETASDLEEIAISS